MPARILSQSLIVDQALALIDEAGLDGFSIRKLGARLGVEPMALYHHFPSRPAVLAAVAARVLAAAPLPAVDGGWRGWCGQAARGFRAAVLAHPATFPLLAARAGDEEAPLFLAQTRVLTAAGFPVTEATRFAHILNAFLLGAVGTEIAAAARAVPGKVCSGFPSGTATEQKSSSHGVFERGLIMLFDGIQRALQNRAP
mgnify:FL=1|jgi:AcrR family transcriptional regulator